MVSDNVVKIVRGFSDYLSFRERFPSNVDSMIDSRYAVAERFVPGKRSSRFLNGLPFSRSYSSREIQDSVSRMSGFSFERDFSLKTGLYLSALINLSTDRSFSFFTHSLGECLPSYFAYNVSGKSISVEGDLDHLFVDMGDTSLEVNGDVNSVWGAAQHMNRRGVNNNIVINGSVNDSILYFEEGTLVVSGDVDRVGLGDGDGAVYVNGDIGSIVSHFQNRCKLYSKGELVSEKNGLLDKCFTEQ